jgi:hypothetical protein
MEIFLVQELEGPHNFGRGCTKLKYIFYWGAIYKLHNRHKIKCWHDLWIGNIPLKIVVPKVYKICEEIETKVVECYNQEGQYRWSALEGSLVLDERMEWIQFETMAHGMRLDEKDMIRFFGLWITVELAERNLYIA